MIAATNAPVEQMAARGEFRADLLDRLDAITLRLPPLREREDDLLLLAATRWRARRPGEGPWCEPGVIEALRSHPWPGNLRELLALIDQAAATASPGPLRPDDLGPLTPENRRPVALFATHSGEGPLQVEGLPRAQLHALATVTLRVPGLRNRGLPSLRQTLLHHLAGMPLHASALVALEALPWWGNQPQVAAVTAALRACPILNAAAVHRLLPPQSGGGAFPIRALMHPTRRPTGEVGGWVQEIEEAGVLVGRARSVGELTRSLGEADLRVATLRQHLGGAAPACLTVGSEARVSRAQALVIREGEGLAVVGIPGAVPSRAGPLGGALAALTPGEALSLGRAGRLVVGPVEAPALCVWFFAGAAAFEAEAGRALDESQFLGRAALLSMEMEAPPTPVAPRPPPVEPPPRPHRRSVLSLNRLPLPPPRGRHVWLLDAEEIALLNHLVLGFRGGDFSGWLQDGLRAAEGPAAVRLRAYINRTRAAQYCCRLYAWEPNKALRAELRARLGPDAETRLRLLPTDIGRSLMG